MKYHSKNKLQTCLICCKGFSLIETVAAATILGFICASVLVVINRAIESTADSALRIRAFEVAHENMEKLLVSDSVSEKVEYGISEKYPEVLWETKVETFYESTTERMWVQAVCSAEYTDSKGEPQTIELTHWLTNLTEEQIQQILEAREMLEEMLAEKGESEEPNITPLLDQGLDKMGSDELMEWIKENLLKEE